MNFQDAVEEFLNGAVKDSDAKSSRIQKLTDDLGKKSKEKHDTAVRKILTSAEPVSQSSIPMKSDCQGSDGYSSDTDVDDPDKEDIDTDEEKLQRTTTQKHKVTRKRVKLHEQFNDSQDSLFNDSLEAELYSTDNASKKQKVITEKPRKSLKERGSNGKTIHSLPEVSSSSNAVGADTQQISIEDIF
ncbi:uncharacterized protein LOC135197895 [Macrobrachium nipponense]|uniref:uncharacterized protein LOC135197895 n=1 Tax=Macrobrachium nipponense TaxID=159736 RepID=UPI0030C85A9D